MEDFLKFLDGFFRFSHFQIQSSERSPRRMITWIFLQSLQANRKGIFEFSIFAVFLGKLDKELGTGVIL